MFVDIQKKKCFHDLLSLYSFVPEKIPVQKKNQQS
jgi:hypothetical protein